MRLCLVAAALCLVPAVFAQKPTVAQPEGTVTGHVYLVDTGGPARLAAIALQPIDVKSDDPPSEDRRGATIFRVYRTGIDGSYRIPHVKPGSYYVVARQPGYLSPFSQFTNKQLSHPSLEDQQQINALLPTVLVAPNNTATMDVHLTRGASISGTVRFDDGSPYPGAWITIYRMEDKQWKPLSLASGGGVDDLGQFRLTGLLAGDYLIMVGLAINDAYVSSLLGYAEHSSSTSHFYLSFYNGETARQRDAKPLHLDASQEMTSADIIIPISKLHPVSGAIVEAKTGRPINSGQVELDWADGGDTLASIKVEPDEPVFSMPFVPEGAYTVKVRDAADVIREEVSSGPNAMPATHIKETVLRKYDPAQQPLTVTTDVSGLNLTVTPAARTPQP
jgi:hypothetical protein